MKRILSTIILFLVFSAAPCLAEVLLTTDEESKIEVWQNNPDKVYFRDMTGYLQIICYDQRCTDYQLKTIKWIYPDGKETILAEFDEDQNLIYPKERK